MSEEGRAQERVKILELRVPSMSLSPALYNAMNAGFNASLWSRNYTLADGFRVERIVKEMEVHGGADAIKEAMKEHKDILLLQGPVGDEPLYHSLAALKEHDLVSFAPLTGSSIVRNWNPHLYFVRTDPAAELLALIHYAVNELRMWRLGFMYLQNVSFGDYEYTRTLDLLNDMDYELCGVFTLKSSLTKSTDDGVFNATWEEFAATRPQAVIVFGAPLKDTAKFVTRMLTDERTAGACLLLPGTLQDGLLETWREAVNGGAPFIPGQVITTGTNPLAKDTQYEAIKRFQTVMERYLASEENKVYNSTKHFLENDNDGEMMVAGWIDGEVLWKALNSHRWARERGSFRRSILSQRRYLIDDLVIGDYGGDCSATAAEEGAICRCNQGGRTVYMKRFVEGYRAEKIMSGELTLPFLKCYTGDIRLYPPLNGIFFLMTDDTYAMRATLGMRAGASAALQGWSNAMNTRIAVLQIINTSTADAKTTLRDEEERKRTHAVCGVMTEEMLDDETVVFIDPQNLHPHLNKFRRRVIRLSTTLEQEFFVLAQYLGNTTSANTTSANTTSANTHAVIRSGEAAAVVNVLRRSLVTFGGSLWSSALLAGGDALGDYLPHDGDVFVVGLAAADISVIAVHLAKHSSVRVFVLWSEVSLFYDEFVAAFNGSAAAAGRLAFATSLPHWADESTTSETVQRFHAAVKDKREWTPLTLRAFASTLLLKTVLSRMDLVNADAVIDFFYKNVVVVVGDIVYGPFKDGKRCGSPKNVNGNECAVNYGARHISVWSMARVVDPSVPELFPAVTPSMEYTGFPEERFLSDQFIAIIVGSATGVLLAAIIVGLLCRQRDARDNNNAPKETTDPVTLVFTDIESSTALWAACPEIMPDAVATHHRLIRSLIATYRCYEVKTIGDSFMIACKSAWAAVQLARDIQQTLLHHDWGTGAIDAAYHEFEEGRAAEDEEYVPPTARLDAAVYRQYWNGLRVRVGVHTGLCDIRHDEVTKGYDYYGGTSNTASRTESVANGGQVLLTGAAYLALSTAEREQLDVAALGGVVLRGVPVPVPMYQLNAVPGRTFAALRLDRQDLDEEEDYASSSELDSSVSGLSGPASFSSHVLVTVFGAFTPPQRLIVLRPYCERWSVRLPPRASSVSDDEYCRLLLLRLSLKIEKVMQRIGLTHESHSFTSSNCTGSLPSLLHRLSSSGEDQGGALFGHGFGISPELGSVEGAGD